MSVHPDELIYSAHMGTNDELFPKILQLYIPIGSKVADVTYGKGVFWREVPPNAYDLYATDIENDPPVDCRDLPYPDNSMKGVVLDPPYMHNSGETSYDSHQNYQEYYRNQNLSTGKYHEGVLDLYFKAAEEAHRVLKEEGCLIVKCQDEVCANRQRLTHVELVCYLEDELGFVCEDLFVLVRQNRPGVSRMKTQRHARKNHSYFLVFRNPKGKKRWEGLEDNNLMEVEGEVRPKEPDTDSFGSYMENLD